MGKFIFMIPEDLHKRFKSYAAIQNKTMRDLIIQLIDERLKKVKE